MAIKSILFILCKLIALLSLVFFGGLDQYSVALVYNAYVERQLLFVL
jgi:hypothetical protein